jgi:hypothetical protein
MMITRAITAGKALQDLEREVRGLRAILEEIQAIVKQQKANADLWAVGDSSIIDYVHSVPLRQELRRLHWAIEHQS